MKKWVGKSYKLSSQIYYWNLDLYGIILLSLLFDIFIKK